MRYQTGRKDSILLQVICVWLFAGVALLHSAEHPPTALGEYGVGHATYTWNDPDRERSLDIDVWYPSDSVDGHAFTSYALDSTVDFTFPSGVAYSQSAVADGTFPLIVSSHGTGLYSTSQASVNERLASHGFIVTALNHTGNSYGDNNVGETSIAKDRVLDVSFAIDQMMAMNGSVESSFSGRVDETKVGTTGLSYGGVTAITAHTGSSGLGVEGDPRIKAVMPITSGVFSWMRQSETNVSIDVPVLMLNGTSDNTNSANQRVFDNLNVEPRYEVIIDKAVHLSYMDVCDWKEHADSNDAPSSVTNYFNLVGFSPWNTCASWAINNNEAIDLTATYAVAFFESYLEGSSDYLTYLTEDAANENGWPVSVQSIGHVVDACAFDFDGSGVCDVGDIDTLLYDGAQSQDGNFDLDRDGTVDLADRDIWLSEFGTFAGDIDFDGRVNSRDLNGLALNWQTTDANSYGQGDFNGDGRVNSSDLNELALKWQASAEAAPVPEPRMGWIVALAFAVLCMRRRSTPAVGFRSPAEAEIL